MNAVFVFTALSALLVIGKILRMRFSILQKMYLPSSVIGGLIGLAVVSLCGDSIPTEITGGMRSVPGFLINVIFATLF